MVKDKIYRSFIYRDTVVDQEGSKTVYAVSHKYGRKGCDKFFDWLKIHKEAELITIVENSEGHFDDLGEIVIEATKGKIDEIQLKTLVEFVRRKIRPLNVDIKN